MDKRKRNKGASKKKRVAPAPPEQIAQMVEVCRKADPFISAATYKAKLDNLSPRRILALRMLSDKGTFGFKTEEDVARALGYAPDHPEKKWHTDPEFMFLIRTLSCGYNITTLFPTVVEVITEGLNRRYENDVFVETDKGDSPLRTHKAGERIIDQVTVGLINQAKGFIDIPTAVTKDLTPKELSDAEKEQEKAEFADMLRKDPVLAQALLKRNVAKAEAEIPAEEIRKLETEAAKADDASE